MKVRSITYQRLKVVKKFENERAEVTIELAPGDTVEGAFALAKDIVYEQLDGKHRIRRAEDNFERRIIEDDDFYYGGHY